MLSLIDRVQAIEDCMILKNNYSEELDALKTIELEIPVYRRLGIPVWKAEEAKKRIIRIREWIEQELSNKV